MRIIFTLLLFCLCATGFSQTTYYSTKSGIAINGYDPVAYFTDHKAVPGKDQFTLTWQGSTWKFASQAHLDSFKQAPEQFAPQYGGFCAFGCSDNHKAPTDPKAFTIVGGKLYLNYDAGVKSLWLKDTTNRIKLADGFWPALNK